MTLRITSLLVLGFLLTATAEESVRSAQEELRRRNIYFGDIDGKRSGEFESALKRYQQRKGFVPTGRDDPDTMRSLGLLPRAPNEPPPKELNWPEEPVLRSDAKVNVPREATALAADSGIAPETVAPSSIPMVPIGERPPLLRRTTPGTASPRGIAAGQRFAPADSTAYVKRYLRAVSKGHLQEELCFYADRVDYYANGPVDRRVIERYVARYDRMWPERSYRLAKVIGYSLRPQSGQIVLSYLVDFSLRNGRAHVHGQTENELVINAATSSPRIVAIRESRVRGKR